MRLCRMLAPHVVESALRLHSDMMRSELDRMVADAGEGTNLRTQSGSGRNFPQGRGVWGCNLQLISEAGCVSALVVVTRCAIKMHINTRSTAAHSVARWFHNNNDNFEQLLARVATQVNVGDAPNSREALLAEPSPSRDDRAWMRSECISTLGKSFWPFQ